MIFLCFQVLTTVAGRYTFRALARFNPERKRPIEDKTDPDELADVDINKIPEWDPPLTDYNIKMAKKDSTRTGHILALPIHAKRFCWRNTEVQVKLMFEFFSSAKCIQNMAYGTIKGKDNLGNPLLMSKVIRLANKTELVANCLSYFKELGVSPPDRSTIFHYLSECFPGKFCLFI